MLGIAAAALSAWAVSTASARTLHFQVTVSVSGPGRVTGTGDGGSIDCPGTCSAMIRQETFITLTATPDGGAQFTSWGGSCTEAGTASTCTLIISGPKEVTAGFGTPPPPITRFNLTVKKAGTGTGFVGGAGGIDCGPTCSAAFQAGTKVNLLAVADDGAEFKGWTGGGCSDTGQCAVTVTADMEVTATLRPVDRAPPHFRTIAPRPHPAAQPSSASASSTTAARARAVRDLQGKTTSRASPSRSKPVHYGRTYTAHWRVPAKRRRAAAATAPSRDKAGNASKRSCSALRIT